MQQRATAASTPADRRSASPAGSCSRPGPASSPACWISPHRETRRRGRRGAHRPARRASSGRRRADPRLPHEKGVPQEPWSSAELGEHRACFVHARSGSRRSSSGGAGTTRSSRRQRDFASPLCTRTAALRCAASRRSFHGSRRDLVQKAQPLRKPREHDRFAPEDDSTGALELHRRCQGHSLPQLPV